MTAKRKWVPIVAGVAILLVFAGIGAAVVGVSWMREHLDVRPSTDAEAASAFADARAKFAGQAPLLELRDGQVRPTAAQAGRPASTASLTMMRVLAFNPRDGKLTRFELPFWLLRFKATPIQFGAYASGLDENRVRLTAEDIERFGPGIVLDYTSDRGERALVWVE